MRPYGKINLFGLILLAAIVGGLYAVVMLGPIYADNIDVQEAVNQAYNLYGRNPDERVRDSIRDKLRNVGTHVETDEFGYEKILPGLALTDEQIVFDRNDPANTVRIEVNYERVVELKPFKKIIVLDFHPSKEGPLPR
jgi:hypothetical protein